MAEEEVPPPKDLSVFWINAEAAVKSLDVSFQGFQSVVGPGHIACLGKILVGAKGWQLLQHQTFASWAQFKAAVEKFFGLTGEQLED